MTITASGLTRVATLVAGVLGVVLPQVASFGLSTATSNTITAVGGVLLAILALLEHPTTKTLAASTFVTPTPPAPIPPPPTAAPPPV